MDVFKKRATSSALIFLFILLFYSAIFISIAIWRYDNFCFRDSADLLVSEQMIYNTLHERPLYIAFEGSGYSEFESHNSPILILLVPFAAVIPVPYVLYIFTVFSIAVSSIPIYFIAREKLKNEFLALLLGTSYILLPTFVGKVYHSFHGINLVLPFLTFAFYYFIKERFYPFIVMFIIALTVKEDVSLTLFMFAIYALIKKRSMKWCLVPAILSITWLILSIKIIIPFFSRSGSYAHISYLSNIGGSFGEIIANTLFKPLGVFKELIQLNKLLYLFILLLPVGLILPFFSAEIIFAIPSIFLNMVGGSQRLRFITIESWGDRSYIPTHMSLMATVFLFISAIYAVHRIRTIFAKHPNLATLIPSLLLISITIYSDRFILISEFYREPSSTLLAYGPSVDSIKRVISAIPREATVRADIDIATHLYDRKGVYLLESPSLSKGSVETDFLVFKVTYPPEIINKYDLVLFEKGIYLLRKKTTTLPEGL